MPCVRGLVLILILLGCASCTLFLEFTNGKWTFVAQPQVSETNLDGTLLTPIGNIPLDIKADNVLFEYWAGRRFGKPALWTEVIIGGRHVELNVDAVSAFGPDEATYDWHDPLVGVRQFVTLNDKWSWETMITASGFGATDESSERSWEGRTFASWRVKPRWDIQFGYRYFKTKYIEQEHSPIPSTLKYKLQGPFIGAAVNLKR